VTNLAISPSKAWLPKPNGIRHRNSERQYLVINGLMRLNPKELSSNRNQLCTGRHIMANVPRIIDSA
jgi:hypothetical protein